MKDFFTKKNIVLIAILLLTNITTFYFASSYGVTSLPKKQGSTTVATITDGKYSSNDLYDKMMKSSGLSSLLADVDEDILNKEYPIDKEPIKSKVDEQVKQTEASMTEKGTTLDAELQKANMTLEDFEKQIALNFQKELATEAYAKTLVTEDELKAEYEKQEPDVRASHILFKTGEASGKTDDEVKAQAQAVLDELKASPADKTSETFAKLAKEHSEDSSATADPAGDLGYSKPSNYVPEFAAALNALKVGEYTQELVKTEYGYHIILKTDETAVAPYKVMKKDLKKEAAQNEIKADSKLPDKAMIDLREQYKFKIKDKELNSQYEAQVKSIQEAPITPVQEQPQQ